MATDRKQLNVRLSPADELRLASLVERIQAKTGFPVRMTDIIKAALDELEKKYPAEEQAQETTKGRSKRSK